MSEQELLRLKKRVTEARTMVAELQGQQKAQIKQLKDEFQCNSIEEAVEHGQKLNKEIETLNEEIEVKIEELQTTYNLEE